jgi:hypothetical protein
VGRALSAILALSLTVTTPHDAVVRREIAGPFANARVRVVLSASSIPQTRGAEVSDGVLFDYDGTRALVVERVLRRRLLTYLQLEYEDFSCGHPCAILFADAAVRLPSSTSPMALDAGIVDGTLHAKLWAPDQPEPDRWIVTADVSGQLPPGDLGIFAANTASGTVLHSFTSLTFRGA